MRNVSPDLFAWVAVDGRPGQLVPVEDARISVRDRGVTIGEGIFETCKVVAGQAVALTRHLERMTRGAASLSLTPPAMQDVREGVTAVLKSSTPRIALGRLRITVTAGEPHSPLSTLIVTAHAIEPWPPQTSAILAPWVRNERSPLAGVKSTSYAENAVALAFARTHGVSEALLANTHGALCEGTASNVFGIRDGRLVTPSLETGCLPGVTRELVLEWFGGAEVIEDPHTFIESVDEAFLTSSTRDVHPLTRLDEREWTAVGPVAARLAQEFQQRLSDDIDP